MVAESASHKDSGLYPMCSTSDSAPCFSLPLARFTYLKGRASKRERGKKIHGTHCNFKFTKSGNLSWSLTGIAGAQILGPSPAAFPDIMHYIIHSF